MQQYGKDDLSEEQVFAGLNAIDVGCGAGILTESLGRLGIGNVKGIDPTPKCIELANEHLDLMENIDDSLKNVSYEETSMEQVIDTASGSKDTGNDKHYDLVCCSEVIEHVNDQAGFLKNCLRLVKPKTGLLFVSSIAKTPEGYFTVIFMGEKVLRLLPQGTHEFDMLINAETVE